METGTRSFLDRFALTRRLEENLVPLLEERGFIVSPFGHPVILAQDGRLMSAIRTMTMKKSAVALMVKFSPDFVCLSPRTGDAPFFMDTKASITPVFFQAHINRLREASGVIDLQREDIAEIEREAIDTYRRYYPPDRVMVCIAAPYHPRLLVAEWASNLHELYRLEVDTNEVAGGSHTPHVNVHLGEMRSLDHFVADEFGQALDPELLKVLVDFIKSWDLNKPGRVNWTQFNNVIRALQPSCPWLKTRNERNPPAGTQLSLKETPQRRAGHRAASNHRPGRNRGNRSSSSST